MMKSYIFTFIKCSLFLIYGFTYAGGGHGHGGHQSHGDHNEHEEHGPPERPAISLTLFSEKSELFLEFPTLVIHQESKFLAHMTYLKNSKPYMDGKAIVILRSDSQPDEVFRVDKIARDGIFTPVVIPKYKDKRRVTLYIQSNGASDVFELGEYQVYSSESEIPKEEEEEESALIPFLKEQQWKTDFGVMKLQVNSMTTRTQAPARVTLAKNAIASIKSPLQGELKEVLVKQLQMVQAGQPLLILKPDIDFINYWYELHSKLETLDLEIKYQSAQEKRVKKLLKQQSASQQELLKTEFIKRKLERQKFLIETNIQSISQEFDIEQSGETIQIIVKAGRSGLVNEIYKPSGVRLQKMEEVLTIVDSSNLHLDIFLPLAKETFGPNDMRFRKIASNEWLNGSLAFNLTKGRWLTWKGDNQKYRIYRLPVLGNLELYAGQDLEVELISKADTDVITVPRTAISVEQGNTYVYVQIDGENYERRAVQTGRRMAEIVEITTGLKSGEWIVSKGLYNLRLAGSADQVPAHGHAH